MPLPTDGKNTLWPPAQDGAEDLALWAQWYSGQFQATQSVTPTTGSAPERLTGGYVHRHAAGSSAMTPQEQPLHAPLAADIAMVSADLLFGEMVDLEVTKGNAKTQARLDELLDLTNFHNTLLQGAEGTASLGGVYLRASWDKDLWDVPFISLAQADQAIPEFAWDRLVAVTLWKQLAEENRVVWRHLERHERQGDTAVILHGLYRGTPNLLGQQVALDSRPETAGLQESVTLPQGFPGLACYYVPNVRPNRRDPKSPLGRADIQRSETVLDALDEVWSSLMRDFLFGRRRIIVPDGALDKAGQGRGAAKGFDPERSVFTELEGIDPANGMKPEAVDFAIRTADHITAAMSLVEQIVSAAGYSPQTFGIRIEGSAESGTALRFREQKTFRTVERKRRYWQQAVAWAAQAMMVLDAQVFGRPNKLADVAVTWPEESTSPMAEAATIQALRQAEAISIEMAVRRMNPGQDDKWIEEEVERIQGESGRLLPAPGQEDGGGGPPREEEEEEPEPEGGV